MEGEKPLLYSTAKTKGLLSAELALPAPCSDPRSSATRSVVWLHPLKEGAKGHSSQEGSRCMK